ncbi:RDD family protein [Nocardia sp. CA-135953]|uniref:RDD family protein n=1 Tax=Nocardia sp. CA-135953 TaxID=3239978 RepID=UPI003D954DD6
MALLGGVASLPATVIFINLGDPGHSQLTHRLAGPGLVLSVILFCTGIFGACMVWIRRRTRTILQRYPWLEYPIGYLTNRRYEWVELRDINGNRIAQLIVSSWAHQIGSVVDGNSSTAWFAGDPRKHGVISAPGGGDFRYAYYSPARQPPEFSFRENRSGTRLDSNGAPPLSVREFQLARDRGYVKMKPVGEPVVVRHGSSDDTRYPSPRLLRRVLAFAIDWALHLGVGLGSAIAVSPEFSVEAVTRFDWKHLGVNPIIALGFWALASVVDRVGVQAIFHATVGKAVFGLRVIRPDDGTSPSFGRLLAVWLVDLYMVVAFPIALVGNGDLPGPDRVDDYFLPAVRRRDIRAHR